MIVAGVQYLYYVTCHRLLKFLLRASVNVSAVDPARLSRPLIIAANHPSRIDPFLLVLLPFSMVRRIIPLHFMTAAIYYDRWWIGPLARHIGSYRLASAGRSVEDYLGDSLKLLMRRRTVVLFPEGQLTEEHLERPAKSGVAQLAMRTGAPILPMRIRGLGKLRVRDVLLRRKRVELTFGPMIDVPSRQPDRASAHALAQHVLQTIRSLQ